MNRKKIYEDMKKVEIRGIYNATRDKWETKVWCNDYFTTNSLIANARIKKGLDYAIKDMVSISEKNNEKIFSGVVNIPNDNPDDYKFMSLLREKSWTERVN